MFKCCFSSHIIYIRSYIINSTNYIMSKVIGTLKKVDKVVDDVENKVGKLDGVFSIIDKSTDAVSLVSDKIIDFVSSAVMKIFSRKKNKKEEVI